MPKLIENYSLGQQIGEGSYGKVYKARHIVTGDYFAVKVISIQRFRENDKLRECFANQKKTLTTIRPCKHIIKYITEFRTENNFYFVYEYCNGGTLESMLKKEGHLVEAKALNIFRQLLEAFKILNEFNIIHRDTKPENILFHNGIVKLADFGFCKGLDGKTDMTATMLGSPIYMAPEVLKGEEYSSKIDIWSLGAVLYQMLFGVCPFQSKSIVELISTIRDTQIKFPLEINSVSESTQTLIRRMLVKEVEYRMRWDELFMLRISPQNSEISTRERELDMEKQKEKQRVRLRDIQRQRSWEKERQKEKNKQLLSRRIQHSVDKTSSIRSTYNAGSSYESYLPTTFKPSFTGVSIQALPSFPQLSRFPQPTLKNSKSIGVTGSAVVFNQSTRRKSITQEHQLCTRGIKTSIDIINVNDRNTLAYSYLILSSVKTKLRHIKQSIFPSEIDLQDIANVVNSELQSVQKSISELRQQLQDQEFDMRMLSDVKIYLSVKFREFECDIKVWYQMVNLLLGDAIYTSSRDKTREEMVSFIRQKLR